MKEPVAEGGALHGRTLVTLDGPAGVGKSTTAREVARRLGWTYLDSGALYRAVTHALKDAGIPEERWPDLTRDDLRGLGLSTRPGDLTLMILHRGEPLDAELRTADVTAAVARVARIPAVRSWLLDTQRAAGRDGRLVADGRDMGTVVFPEAATKIFLEADPEERARRRLGDRGVDAPGEHELRQERERLEARDRVDMEREVAPLRPAPDALRLDSTDLTFEEQVDRIVREARRAIPHMGPDPR